MPCHCVALCHSIAGRCLHCFSEFVCRSQTVSQPTAGPPFPATEAGRVVARAGPPGHCCGALNYPCNPPPPKGGRLSVGDRPPPKGGGGGAPWHAKGGYFKGWQGTLELSFKVRSVFGGTSVLLYCAGCAVFGAGRAVCGVLGAGSAVLVVVGAGCTGYLVFLVPFALRLSQGCGDTVHNHVRRACGVADAMRCKLVPYEPETCWREICGFGASLKAPQMMEMDAAGWREVGSRWVNKIPHFMRRKGPRPAAREAIPPLRHGWRLRPRRFPAVPYGCLSKHGGLDRGCYGRVGYAQVHPTVHSLPGPRHGPALVPFAPRVMTVREKARVQGFPDGFTFHGTVESQYKQIANAVSPQLTKFLCRALLDAHLRGLGAAARAVEYSESLRTFRDFMGTFDEEAMLRQTLERHPPQPIRDPPVLSPMTYEEFIVEYNSEARTDHSVRNAHKTPFQVLLPLGLAEGGGGLKQLGHANAPGIRPPPAQVPDPSPPASGPSWAPDNVCNVPTPGVSTLPTLSGAHGRRRAPEGGREMCCSQ